MGLFIDCHLLFEVQFFRLSLHIELLSFKDSELGRGRYKMEFQVDKLEHFRHNLLFEFISGAKAAEAAGNLCTIMGTMPSVRARQENGFVVLRRIVLTLVTLHVQEDLRGLMKIVQTD